MKQLLFLGLIIGLLSAKAQTPSSDIPRDTVQNDTVHITPYLSKTSTRALGNFAVVGSDKIALQTYAGLNIYNTLRGHVPDFSIGPNTYPTSAGLRSDASLMVIDGLPFNSDFSNFYNLNSFEYQSLLAINSGNGTTLYGGSGSNGAFFLQSKTGENYDRPTFEFNSSTTLLQTERTGFWGEESDPSNQLVLTNAVAYKQDFGAVDTRVSYNFSHWPEGSLEPYSKTNYYNLKISTGFEIAPRFKGRLIFDNFYNRYVSDRDVFIGGQEYHYESETVKKNLQGNLQLQYQVLDWLGFSSQSSLGKIEERDRTKRQSITTLEYDQNRSFANIFANFNKTIGDFTGTAFAGWQYERLKLNQEFKTGPVSGGLKSEFKTTSLLAGAGLQFKNFLFSNFNFRQDELSIYAEENNKVPTYSVSAAFLFSEIIPHNNSVFSLGKFRASVGKSNVALRQGYPTEWTLTSSGGYPNPDLRTSSKKMFEVGTDLAFIDNKLGLNVSYFSDRHEDIATQIPINPGSGYSYVWANFWMVSSKGWEIVLSGTPIRKSNFTIETKLIWSTYNNEVESNAEGVEPDDDDIIVIGNPTPDWTGSFLTQITLHNFFTSFLIDGRKGGDIITTDFTPSGPTFAVQDGSMAKLRDLSVGYRLSTKVLEKLKIREALISMSGRNLWTIHSETENDIESYSGAIPQKSGTLSLTLMF